MIKYYLRNFLQVDNPNFCEENPEGCCYDNICSVEGDSTWIPPPGSDEADAGCREEGCCHDWCQCFMGYSFYRDCGEDKVWDGEGFRCAELWEKAECGVTTTTTE